MLLNNILIIWTEIQDEKSVQISIVIEQTDLQVLLNEVENPFNG